LREPTGEPSGEGITPDTSIDSERSDHRRVNLHHRLRSSSERGLNEVHMKLRLRCSDTEKTHQIAERSELT